MTIERGITAPALVEDKRRLLSDEEMKMILMLNNVLAKCNSEIEALGGKMTQMVISDNDPRKYK